MTIRAILLGTAAIALLASPAAAAAKPNNNAAYDQRLDQLEQTVQQQNAEIQQLKAGETADAQSAQDDAQTQAQVEALQNQIFEGAAATKSAWWQNTKVSGRMYFDATSISQKSNGVDTPGTNGVGFDIKRFYVGIDHKFDDIFSANVTTDFTYDSTTKATQLYLKKAYLDAHIDDALDIRLGSTDLPWVPFVEDLYGYRYVENVLIDRDKIGTSADWGVHANGKLAGGMFNYAVSVIDGAGYKAPPGSGNTVHFKSVDVEGRVSANFDGFVIGAGGYMGKLGKDMQVAAPAVATHHTASRFDAIAAYTSDQFRVGVEYFSAKNWFNVASATTTDKDDGYSAFASYQFDPQWGVFGRYDWASLKTTATHPAPTPPTITPPKDGYFNVGISYSPVKIVDLSLVYKHDRVNDGAIASSNGTIGGVSAITSGTYNEIGLFGQLRW